MHRSFVVFLLVLWTAALVTSTTMGGFIHLLPVAAAAVVLSRLIRDRRGAGGARGLPRWSVAVGAPVTAAPRPRAAGPLALLRGATTMKTTLSLTLAGAGAAALLWLVAAPDSTPAYTVSALVGAGCHEGITSAALRAVRLELQTAAPLPVTSDEHALVADLEFTPDADMRDLGGATLLVGVRDNDLKGKASNDLSLLGRVHGDPANQDEHCLRNGLQDEPGGTAAAVADCRTFIRGRVVEALEGLGASGAPDPARRTSLPLHLSLRGSIKALLPTYYVRMGQALHAVEDAFSHTYRTADGMQITVALNWIEEAGRTRQESRDGPAHASAMDACDDPDPLRTARRRLATEASAAILRATLDPQRTKDEKMATVDTILDTYLGYSPGCTFDNDWCSAPERQYKDKATSTFGCSSAGGGALGGLGALLGLAVLSRRRRALGSVAALLLAAGATAFPPGRAGAAEPEPAAAAQAEPAPGEKHAPPAPVVVPVVQPGPKDPTKGAWGGYLGISGSVDHAAAAIQVGVLRKLSTHWTVGWDVEWNPWITKYGATAFRSGVANTSGTVILRVPLAYENFNLRTTLNLGVSYLLFDLYGAPKGSLGYFAAISPLGVEWKVSRKFFLIFNPLSIAVPVPQTRGVPLVYTQYRISLGLGILGG